MPVAKRSLFFGESYSEENVPLGRLVLLASLGNLIGRQRGCGLSEPAGHKVDNGGGFVSE